MVSGNNTSSSGSGRSSKCISEETNSIVACQKCGNPPLYSLTLPNTLRPSVRETVDRSVSLATEGYSATGLQRTLTDSKPLNQTLVCCPSALTALRHAALGRGILFFRCYNDI